MVNLEVGKYYRNRRGSKVGPILATKNAEFPFRVAGINGGTFYTADGRFDVRKPSVVDLVSEWVDPNDPTVRIDEQANPVPPVKIVREVPPLNIIGVDVQRDGNYTATAEAADAAVMTNAAQEGGILPAPDQAPVSKRITLSPDLRNKLDARKPRGRPKGTADKAKAVKEYVQVKKEIAEKFDKPVRAPKAKKAAKPAVAEAKIMVETAEAVADDLIADMTATIEQMASRAIHRGRIDRAEAKLLGAIIYAASSVIILQDRV